MNLTDEQIQQIEEMAAALLPSDEIALLLKLDSTNRKLFAEIVKTHIDSPIYMAFHQGRLSTKLELRKTVIKLAKHGSPAAEPIAEKYIREQLQ
jgi:hypothetical protein